MTTTVWPGGEAYLRASRDPDDKEGVMFRISIRRPLLVLALGLTLTSAASASPVSWASSLTEESRGLWQFLHGMLEGFHGKRGCTIDPNGRAVCPPPITPKQGCTISPDG